MKLVLCDANNTSVREWLIDVNGDNLTIRINDLATALEIRRYSYRGSLDLREGDQIVKVWPMLESRRSHQ